MTATVEVRVPDIGDFKEVAVIELLVKPGDRIAAEQSLVTVESDKASMEIPSSHAGVVKELKVKLGDKVAEGSVLALVEPAARTAPAGAVGSPPPSPSPSRGREDASPSQVRENTSPAVAAAAYPRTPDHESDKLVQGAGPGG